MCSSNANILLTGDVNGHTGELRDFVETDDYLTTLFSFDANDDNILQSYQRH